MATTSDWSLPALGVTLLPVTSLLLLVWRRGRRHSNHHLFKPLRSTVG